MPNDIFPRTTVAERFAVLARGNGVTVTPTGERTVTMTVERASDMAYAERAAEIAGSMLRREIAWVQTPFELKVTIK